MAKNDMKLPRSFGWLNVTQFLGALNDNVFRWLVVFFLRDLPGNEGKNYIIPLVTIIFVLPFLLFSHSAGVLADRYKKKTIIVFSKWLELLIMVVGSIGIYFANQPLLYIILFMMCFQSAIFGPSKYGIIPEMVGEEKLSKANGYIAGLTYLAIIFGTFLPSYILKEVFIGNHIAVAGFCIAFSVFGVLACVNISQTPAVGSGKKFSLSFISEMFKTLFSLKKDMYLFLAVLGSVYFLFLGGFIQQNLVIYGIETLGQDSAGGGFLFPAVALGIAIGAVSAGKLSGRSIEFGIVPIGAFIITICCIALGFLSPEVSTGVFSLARFVKEASGVLLIIFFLGIGAGFFVLPLTAFIQYRSPKERLGEILACVNFFSFIGVGLSAGFIYLFLSVWELSPKVCFIMGGVLTAILAVVATIVLPDFLIRFVIVCITKFFYRIESSGQENIPVRGSALLVSNHVTWVDTLLISATHQRRVRYMMGREIYEKSLLKPLFRLMKVILVSQDDPPRKILASIKEARAALDNGELVCIFAEGALTRNGNMQGFKPGLERIVKGSDCPIIPVCIGGAWGSIFSHYYGKILSVFPKKIPYPVTVQFGRPLPATTSSKEVREAVLELSSKSFEKKKSKKRVLPRMFIETARKNWFSPAVSDTTGKSLRFGRALIASIALSEELERTVGSKEKVGVVLPTSVGGALANIALSLSGRVPVNLNFTASEQSIKSAIKQCNIETVISSRAFLDKLKDFPVGDEVIFLEDVLKKISTLTKIKAILKALFAPASALMSYKKVGPNDLATVIFSSGSTGEPKGVMLSHHNIISNIESFSMVFRFGVTDRVCGILPLFHSFGFTCLFWCPLIRGFSACYHPNPLDATKIAELIRRNKSTIFIATPTFLLGYIRKAKREDFATVRAVIVGAEKLKKRVADSFEEKFGIRPLEGYGTTELSPAANLNVYNVDVGGTSHIGMKDGGIGHPIPGVVEKIVDPDTGLPLPYGKEGLLMVKGPNVMLGYLNDPEKTKEVLRDGWYNTGDIAKMDEDGFVFILDRMSRFSKIGGEMVPHVAIEEKMLEVLQADKQSVFIMSASDEKKGEQLVVVYTDEAGDAKDLHKIMKESDLPNLWKPRKENYVRIEAVPVLGSGKVDLKQLKTIAREFVENKPGKVAKVVEKIREKL